MFNRRNKKKTQTESLWFNRQPATGNNLHDSQTPSAYIVVVENMPPAFGNEHMYKFILFTALCALAIECVQFCVLLPFVCHVHELRHTGTPKTFAAALYAQCPTLQVQCWAQLRLEMTRKIIRKKTVPRCTNSTERRWHPHTQTTHMKFSVFLALVCSP